MAGRNRKQVRYVVAAALMACGYALGQGEGLRNPPSLDAAIRAELDVSAYEIQSLGIPDGLPEWCLVEVRLNGTAHVLELSRHSIRSVDFKLFLQDDRGEVAEVDAPPSRTYRGAVVGDALSEVRASMVDGALTAMIRLGDGREFNVQPLADIVGGAGPADQHIVFDAAATVAPAGTCGTEAGGGEGEPESANDDGGLRGTLIKICQIGIEADFPYYQSLSSNVTNVTNDIESIMNGIDVIYERDVLITYEVTQILVRTAVDPYTSTNPNTLLSQFDTQWTTNFSAVERDVAHLFTGRNVDGGVIGIAQTSTICNLGSAYGLSQSRYTSNLTLRRSLTAHELGHNWSALHCDADGVNCHIMCSANGGCGDPAPDEFGATSIASITAFRNSRSCLTTMPDPITPPFMDNFETGLLAAKWTENEGAAIVAQGGSGPVAPPSPSRALALDASGAGQFLDDDIRTNEILLPGVVAPVLTYWVQRRGVESGEQLVVEVYTSANRWQEVNRLTSDGVDQSTFQFFSHAMGGAFQHSAMRVRFRAEVNETNDRWYIDDVYVGPGLGACCQTSGACISTTRLLCMNQGGTFNGESTQCADANCPQPTGACCRIDGTCGIMTSADCAAINGTYRGGGTVCETANCPIPMGACCLLGGDCFRLTEAQCQLSSGSWAGPGTLCSTTDCQEPVGACCVPDGSCSEVTLVSCTAMGGTWHGAATVCAAENCPQPTGACCMPAGQPCQVLSAADCTGANGAFHGVGSTCGMSMCPSCACDWNGLDGLDSQDFFDFLEAFFAGDADFNGIDGTDSQDYFDFLECLFEGCPAA